MSSALDSIYHIVLTMVYIAALSLLIFAIFANLVENSKYEDPLYWLPYLCFKFDSPPSCSFCSCFLGWLCNCTKSNVLIHHINDIFFVIMDLDLMSLKTCYCVVYALIKVPCSLMAFRKWHVFCWYTDSVLQVHIHIHTHTPACAQRKSTMITGFIPFTDSFLYIYLGCLAMSENVFTFLGCIFGKILVNLSNV